MASYAYIDKEKTQIKYAKDCTDLDSDKEYYCQTPSCSAILRICGLNSTVVSPYFKQKSNIRGHDKDFCYVSTKSKCKPTDFSEVDFNFIEFMDKLITPPTNINRKDNHQHAYGDDNRRFFSSLLDIYEVFGQIDVNDTYNGYEIKKILCDSRSNFLYKNGIYGKRIVECRYLEYNDVKKSIFFQHPLDPNCHNKHKLKAVFNDLLTYEIIRNRVANRGNFPIIIAGDWFKDNYVDGVFYCRITNRKQIQLPR